MVNIRLSNSSKKRWRNIRKLLIRIDAEYELKQNNLPRNFDIKEAVKEVIKETIKLIADQDQVTFKQKKGLT